MTFETQQRTATGGDAVRPMLSARRCGCGASPGLDGTCEECRRNRLTSSQSPKSAVRDATEGASASPPPGHDFGRVSVLAPQDQTPVQSGGLDEKFINWNTPAAGAAQPAGPELDTGEKKSQGANTPVVDRVELVTSSGGAVGGYEEGIFSCKLSLNKPEPFNDPAFTGSVANVHQVQFHLSQGRPEDIRAKRLVKRTSDQNGNIRTKPGTDGSADDGPPLHEYRFTNDKMVIADAPGYCWGVNGLKESDFPATYTADFSTYAFDPLTNRVLASIAYRVEIHKTHYSEGNPRNTATVTDVKIGAAVASPVQPKK